jgi:hypothetical protein
MALVMDIAGLKIIMPRGIKTLLVTVSFSWANHVAPHTCEKDRRRIMEEGMKDPVVSSTLSAICLSLKKGIFAAI